MSTPKTIYTDRKLQQEQVQDLREAMQLLIDTIKFPSMSGDPQENAEYAAKILSRTKDMSF